MSESSNSIANFFLCIGAQKSGTDWLWEMFSTHPDLFLTPVKEIHYFDHVRGLTHHLDDRRRRARLSKFRRRLWRPSAWRLRPWYRDYISSPVDDAWYANLFRHREDRCFAGEATPEYAIIGEEGYHHIQRLSPDVRILFIMRNPVTRAWSQANHQARRMKVDLSRLAPERAVEVMQSAPNFAALSDYPATIKALRRVFNAEQICLSFYEEAHADRRAALAKWCHFIGIGYRAEWFKRPETVYNVGQATQMQLPVRMLLRERYRLTVEEVRNLVGRVPPSWEIG